MTHMRRISAAIVVLLLVSIAMRAQEKHQDGPANPAAPPPQLVIESLTHDFGEVKAGEPLRFAFKVKNTGKGELHIDNVSPG